jgi:hypothetical protein
MKNGMTVKKFLTQNPNASTRAVMIATGAKAKTVGTIRSVLRKEGVDCRPLRRGRPRKAKRVIDLTIAGSPLRQKIRMAPADRPEFGTSNVDLVNHPPHYTQGGVETIDFIEAKKLNYNLGNAVKYITRADHKGTRLQDLQKAKWYLEREILSQHI